jgi:hypothetical protein
MGSKSKKSGSGITSASANQQTAPQQYSYGGINMTQAEAQKKYQADMAAWRAPTTTGTGTHGMDTGTITQEAQMYQPEGAAVGHLGVPVTQWGATGLGGGGPALPKLGVLPTAPVVVPRQQLAINMNRQPYQQLNRGGHDGGNYSTSQPGSAANRSGSSAYGGYGGSNKSTGKSGGGLY